MHRATFKGYAFAPDLPEDRVAGALHVGEDTVDLVHDAGTVSLLRQGLVLRMDGNVATFVHLTHPNHPGVGLVTDNLAILQDSRWADDASFQAQYQQEIRRGQAQRQRFRWAIAGTVLVSLALLVVLLLVSRNLLGWAFTFLP